MICVSTTKENEIVVSLREAEIKKIPKIQELTQGQLIRCSYSHMDKDSFVFTAPIRYNPNYKVIVPINVSFP